MAKTDSVVDPATTFKSDLNFMAIIEVVRKHISTGQPTAFSSDDYFNLRSTVAQEFRLHLSSVIVVGSTRMGFSLNPKHRYRQVTDRSDIDVAIVSQTRFDDYWDRVFECVNSDLAWEAKKFKNSLFNGWIDPRHLPNTSTFDAAHRWTQFFDSLMASRKYGRRRITARLYRSWSRLEAYQERAVRACKLSGSQ